MFFIVKEIKNNKQTNKHVPLRVFRPESHYQSMFEDLQIPGIFQIQAARSFGMVLEGLCCDENHNLHLTYKLTVITLLQGCD